jgi:hypothetical protein
MEPTPKVLTHSLPLFRPAGLPIYVAGVPAAPFGSRLAERRDASLLDDFHTLVRSRPRSAFGLPAYVVA